MVFMQTKSRYTHSLSIKNKNRSLPLEGFEASSTFALNYTEHHDRAKSRLSRTHLIFVFFSCQPNNCPWLAETPNRISRGKKNGRCCITFYVLVEVCNTEILNMHSIESAESQKDISLIITADLF